MPANPPFQSQFAARPNNRRHPTNRPPHTRKQPPPSRNLSSNAHDLSSNTRDLSYSAHTSTREFAPPLPSPPCAKKSPKIITANPASEIPPKITVQTTVKHLRPATRLSRSRTCANVPLPSRKSPQIPKITVQTTRPTQITAHPQYPMTSNATSGVTIPKISQNPANPLSTKSQPIPKMSTIHWCPPKTYPPPDRELLCYSLSDV